MDDETQTSGSAAPAQADTASSQPSEADVQINNDAPEVAQETKEPEVNATDTADEKLYAGKYKSPEDMEKAYKELESKFGQETSEKAELTRILNEAFATPAASATDTVSEADDETTPQVNAEFEQMKRDNAVIKFIVGHQDADATAMKDILTNDPLVKQIQGHDAKLEYAYLRSQNIAKPKAIEEAKKAGQTQAQAKTAEKQAAQVESAKKTESVSEDSDYQIATGNYTQEQRDRARQSWIKKNLINL